MVVHRLGHILLFGSRTKSMTTKNIFSMIMPITLPGKLWYASFNLLLYLQTQVSRMRFIIDLKGDDSVKDHLTGPPYLNGHIKGSRSLTFHLGNLKIIWSMEFGAFGTLNLAPE